MLYGDVLPGPLVDLLDVLCEFAKLGQYEAISAGGYLGIMALQIKHPALYEEREWRIVIRDPQISHVMFRADNGRIRPYIELCPRLIDGSTRLPLKRIWLGPTLPDDAALNETIEMMLERYGYTGVDVQPSGMPFRL